MREILQFVGYSLDVVNAQLCRGTQIVPLRPKTLAVLHHLAARPAQLITKAELLDTIWADTAVGEYVLTGCVQELRRALGDDARTPRIIETAHRRGYRFIAPVQVSDRRVATPVAEVAESARPRVVGRDAELQELRTWLQAALAGERQIGFVAGEAGIGKTTLVEIFLETLSAHDTEVLIGRGQCVDQPGGSEPYLPLLEALGRLCAGPGGERLSELLRHRAPAWLLQLPGLLEAGELEQMARQRGTGTQTRMLREMALFVEALPWPLVLILEDLHWSDRATLDLVAMLAQKRAPAKLLVVGTYRPVEVAVRAHPLKELHHRLRAHGQCRDLWMQPLDEDAVADYLRGRWPDIAELPALAHLVHDRTDGNPLFLVNVADSLVANGVIVEINGRWSLKSDVATLGVAVPHGLGQMIATQIERLGDAEREMLEVGSLVGRTFSAALVATVLDADVVAVEDQLARLAQSSHVVQAAGEIAWPDTTVAGAFRFTHSLYQSVLRDRVLPAQRRRRYGRAAACLEAAYGDQRREIASELAFYFEASGQPDRAVPYVEEASERAVCRGAGREAVAMLQHGIALLDGLPSSPDRTQHTIRLCLRLGGALPSVIGLGHPDTESAYLRARTLSQQTDNPAHFAQASAGLVMLYISSGQLEKATEAAQSISPLTEYFPLPLVKFGVHFFIGAVRYHTGPLTEALHHLETATAVEDFSLPPVSADVRIIALAYHALTLLHLGQADRSRVRGREMTDRAATGRPFERGTAAQVTCFLAILTRDTAALANAVDEASTIGSEHDFPAIAAIGRVGGGLVVLRNGDAERGLAMMREGVDAYRGSGQIIALPLLRGTFAEALLESGDLETASLILSEARALVDSIGERRFEVELHRLEGEICSRRNERGAAERCFHRALEIARDQGARWWELRAATSLARLALATKRTAAGCRSAHDTLDAVVSRFTEGFDTVDMQQAKRALTELVG